MWGKREVYCIGKYKKKSTTNQDKNWTISAYIHSSNAFALVTAMATKLQTCTHTNIHKTTFGLTVLYKTYQE